MNAPPRRRPPVDEPSRPAPLAEALTTHRAGLGAIAVITAAALIGWQLWDRFAEAVRANPDTVLFPEAIDVEGIAPWVRGDLRTEALRNASLDGGLPLDDPELPQRLERAFAMHPWVRQVERVTLREPAAAAIEVRCREPVAMVGVPGGLLAVDAEGVVLPSADFTAEAAAEYPRVVNVLSSPLGVEGSRWGDPLVHEAAAVAAAIGPDWKQLGLRELRAADTPRGRVWELVGPEARTIRFGAAPGQEQPGEPAAAVKLGRLRGLADTPAGTEPVDLTQEPGPAGDSG
ncbi:MAG: hypothetical protein RLZZ21_1916 [Planctomycetota bacterium]|jgi:hypothetical protein